MKKRAQIRALHSYITVLEQLLYEHHKTSYTALGAGAQCPICTSMNGALLAAEAAARG